MFQIIWYWIYINTEKQAYRKYTGHKKLAWVNISYCTILAGVGKGIVAIRSEWIQGGNLPNLERESEQERKRERKQYWCSVCRLPRDTWIPCRHGNHL